MRRRRTKWDGRRQRRAFLDAEKVERDAKLRAIAETEIREVAVARTKAMKARAAVWLRYGSKATKAAA